VAAERPQPQRQPPRSGGIIEAVVPAMKRVLGPLNWLIRAPMPRQFRQAVEDIVLAVQDLDAKLRELDAKQARCPFCAAVPPPEAEADTSAPETETES